MSDLPLRAACVHGRYDKHANNVQDWWCPGGREVTIDYEAALAQVRKDGADEPWKVTLVVDAALAIGDTK